MTSAPTISPERIAQIADRKLSQLGIPHSPTPTPGVLEGVISFSPGRLVNPVSTLPIGRGRFVTVGHDKLRFVEPPLSVFGALPFYEANSIIDFEGPLVTALSERGELIKKLAARFEALRLKTRVEPDELVVLGELETPECRFLIEGGASGVRLRSIFEGGKVAKVSPTYPALDLKDFPAPVDLELHLSDCLPAIRAATVDAAQGQSAEAAGQARQAVVLEACPPPMGALTVGYLAERFGAGAIIVPGERIEATAEFIAGGIRYRFVATHEAGTSFRARLSGPRGVLWQDRINLERFPGMLSFVATTLGVPTAASARAPEAPSPLARPAAAAPSAASAFATDVPVAEGEVWVMSVIIHSTAGQEIRYACTDVNGQRYGALRVLSREDFEKIFCPHGGGWRLLIRIERVEGDKVLYRQLNAERRASPELKALHRSVLTTTFVPEAAAY